MNGFKRLTMLALAAGALLVSGSVFAQDDNDRLIIGAGAEITTLDPRLATDVPSFERIGVIMEPLVVYDYGLSLAPRLATDWTFSDDGLTLTFNLRDDVTFHAGSAFTRADVTDTLQ